MRKNYWFFDILHRELALIFRQPADWLQPLLFFIIVISLFPLAFSADSNLLPQIAPGLIWVTALFATLLALDRIFRDDFEDGSIELILLSTRPLSIIALIKVFAHWLMTGLPIVIIAPLIGFMLHLTWLEIQVLMLSLLLGTPILSLIGAIIAALTVALKNNGLLLALLLLPLYIPVMIFGAGSVVDAGMGLQVAGQLAILAAILILALTTAPFAISGALRVGYE